MQRLLPAWLAILLASLVSTQNVSAQNTGQPADPLIAARTRLQAALVKTAATPDTAFAQKWAEDGKKKDAGGVMVFGTNSGATPGEASGSWHQGLVACKFVGDNEDELLVAGRRTIAKASDKGWTLRRGRFADGNTVDFVPDPEQLLDLLAGWDLNVARRETGSLDDRPMEVLLVTLSAEQVAEVAGSGLFPPALLAGGMNPFAIMIAMQQGGARPAPAAPSATVDLAITLDPATSLIHKLQFRSWSKQDQNVMAGRVVMVRAQGAVVQGGNAAGNDDDDEEEAEKEGAAAKADSPLKYENGLPVRSRKKTTVMDFTVRFQDHGKAAAPSLSADQKKLLKL